MEIELVLSEEEQKAVYEEYQRRKEDHTLSCADKMKPLSTAYLLTNYRLRQSFTKMTNSKKLESLFTNIGSKAAIFMDGYLAGVADKPSNSNEEMYATLDVEFNIDRAKNIFKQRCLDINLYEDLDGYFIDYLKLILHPDDEYVPVKSEDIK